MAGLDHHPGDDQSAARRPARGGAAPPEALGLWREPWTDEEGAHLFVDLFERCLEVVRRPDGRVLQRTAWENPRLRSNPDEFWME